MRSLAAVTAFGAIVVSFVACGSNELGGPGPPATIECEASAPCPAGAVCVSGRCVPSASGGTAGASSGGVVGASGAATQGGGLAGGGSGNGGTSGDGGTSAGLGGDPAGGGAAGGGAAGSAPAGGVPSGGAGGNGGAANGGSAGQGGGASGMGGINMGGGAGASGGSATGGVPNPPGTCETAWDGFTNYNGNGSITYYEFNMGTKENVNCNFGILERNPDVVDHVYTGNGRHFAAMNTSDWRNAAACGSCVQVTGPNGMVTVTVVDQCPVASNPVCQAGHLDLSREAFRQIANEADGIVQNISWRYVPCPVPDDQELTVQLEQPSNEFYTTLLVQDHVFPIQSVQIKGQTAGRRLDPGSGNYDGYFMVGDGNQAPAPWPIRITDVNGWVFEVTLNLNQGGDVSTSTQVDCN